MIQSSNEISFYVDTLIVEAICEDPSIVKRAAVSEMVMSLIAKVKDYFSSKIDPNDKSGSVINMLAPGAISVALSALGLPWIGVLFGLATSIFHIDIASSLRSIYGSIKSLISGDRQISSQQVDAVVKDTIQAHYQPLSAEEEVQVSGKLSNRTSVQKLRDARLVKLALVQYSNSLNKQGIGLGGALFVGELGSKLVTVLTSILGWIFKIALASGGLLLAGDAVNKFLGRFPAAATTSTPTSGGTIPASTTTVSTIASKQTKFKLNPAGDGAQFTGNRVENYPNTVSGISQMVLDFAKEVYEGLDGLDSVIRSAPGFKSIVEMIAWHNHTAAGDPVVFIPEMFKSKKHLVDFFIDDVAAKSP